MSALGRELLDAPGCAGRARLSARGQAEVTVQKSETWLVHRAVPKALGSLCVPFVSSLPLKC